MEQREPKQNQEQSGTLFLPPEEETQYVPVAKPSPNQAADDHLQNVFYVRDDVDASLEDEGADVFGSAPPFQFSETLSPVRTRTGQIGTGLSSKPQPTSEGAATIAPSATRPAVRRFLTKRMIMPAAIVVMLLLAGTLTVFAQATPPLPAHTTSTPTVLATNQTNSMVPKATSRSTQGNKPTTARSTPASKSSMSPSSTALPQLPTGWIDANLAMGDALFAERTATNFTDHEMSLTYRSVGTRAVHAGTFTAATFILTAHAQTRFRQNDLREINNVLFDKVQQEHLIQSVFNPQAQLVKFAEQGQQQFAWLDVSFFLWQSKQENGQRIDGFDADSATGQPRLHHMTVLLQQQQDQGNNPPMGGTGWLVSNYGLDLPSDTSLQVVQPA